MSKSNRYLETLAEKTGIPKGRLAEIIIEPKTASDEDRVALARVTQTNPESLELEVSYPTGHKPD